MQFNTPNQDFKVKQVQQYLNSSKDSKVANFSLAYILLWIHTALINP